LDSPRREGTEGELRREDGKARLSHNAAACRALTRNQKNLEKAKESVKGKFGCAQAPLGSRGGEAELVAEMCVGSGQSLNGTMSSVSS